MSRGLIIGLIVLILVSCTNKDRLYRQTDFVMDTIVTITFPSKDESKAVKEAFERLRTLEKKLNAYAPDSEVSEINRGAGIRPVSVSSDTYELVKKAVKISEVTEGAFDITVGAVSFLYDFEKKVIPAPFEIKERLPLVGYKGLSLSEGKVFLQRQGMRIDTGGIAKGYGADEAVKVLKAEGVSHALVAVAGDIKALGSRPGGGPWRVGIKDPRGGPDDIFAVVSLPSDWAISTSGDYERYVIKDGVRYHHIIDPRTGMPARGLISVSCIGPEATLTDSLATAVFILGKREGVRVAEGLGYGVVIVDQKGHVYVSPTARKITEILYEPKVQGP